MGRLENGRVVELQHTDRILTIIGERYNKLAKPLFYKGFKIKSENLYDLLDKFEPILSREKDFDKQGILEPIFYAVPRLPEEIFFDNKNITLRFNDDPDFFCDDLGKKKGVTKPKLRNRFHKVEIVKDETNPDDEKTLITVHAQSQTAVIETFVNLSIVETLRHGMREIFKFIELEQITSEHSKFLQKIVSLITKHLENEIDHIKNLKAWANKEISIEGVEGMASWQELISTDEQPAKTAKKLAEKVRLKLEGNKKPEVLMFSNSFSIPNLLSHYLLNGEKNGVNIRDYIKEKALYSWYQYNKSEPNNEKSTLETLGESIEKIEQIKVKENFWEKECELDVNTKNFMIDNFILFDLTKDRKRTFDDEIIDDFIKDFYDHKRMSDYLGIETLVSADTSPTSEPIHYINFSKLHDKVINSSNPLFKDILINLRKKGLTIVYTPYLPGDLSYSTIVEIKKLINSIVGVAEVGKVASLLTNERQRYFRDIGQMVIPVDSLSSHGDPSVPKFINQVKIEHAGIFKQLNVVFKSILMSVPCVILQHSYEVIQRSTSPNIGMKDITINMEVGPITRAITKLGLLLFEVDYISDHVIGLELIKKLESAKRKNIFQQIDKSLGRQGVFSVAAATFTVLKAMTESKELFKKH